MLYFCDEWQNREGLCSCGRLNQSIMTLGTRSRKIGGVSFADDTRSHDRRGLSFTDNNRSRESGVSF
jgi:hypothetical protein